MPPGFLHHHSDGHLLVFLYWIPSSPQFTASCILTSTPVLVAPTSCNAPNISIEELHFLRTCWPKLSLIYHHTSLILQMQELLILLPVSPLQGAGNPRLVIRDTVAWGTAVPVFWLPASPRCQPGGDSPHCSRARAAPVTCTPPPITAPSALAGVCPHPHPHLGPYPRSFLTASFHVSFPTPKSIRVKMIKEPQMSYSENHLLFQ